MRQLFLAHTCDVSRGTSPHTFYNRIPLSIAGLIESFRQYQAVMAQSCQSIYEELMKREQAQEEVSNFISMTEPEKVSSASSLVLNGRRILVVESNPDNAFIWTMFLEEAGASVIQANKASVALVALEREQLDLIISNIYLEDEDGFSLIRKIRAHESKGDKEIPAIAVESAWNPDVSSTTVKEAGFQLFMSRPIDIDEVIRAIVSLTE